LPIDFTFPAILQPSIKFYNNRPKADMLSKARSGTRSAAGMIGGVFLLFDVDQLIFSKSIRKS
jgi:hypothetical protein